MKICCPACMENFESYWGADSFQCQFCKKVFSRTQDNIIDLRLDKTQDTLLNIDTYDEEHGVTGAATSCHLWCFYKKCLEMLGANLHGSALEIASGTGHLSLGLIADSTYKQIFLSDVSPGFMQILHGKLRQIPTHKSEVVFFLFDANNIPFSESQFDLVIGNSVLHHFATFESTLKSAYRVLNPGGIAIFGEPVMDTYVFMSLSAKLIFEVCKIIPEHPLSQYDLMIVNAMSKLAGKQMQNLRSSRTDLGSIEDKFVFPVNYMRSLSETIGFKKFECITPDVQDFSAVIKKSFSRIFEQQKIDLTKLDYFDFVFNSIGSTYGYAMKEEIKASFSLFAFVKS